MTPKAGYRGQPVFMLVVLLGGWVALRAATWEPVQFAGRLLRIRPVSDGPRPGEAERSAGSASAARAAPAASPPEPAAVTPAETSTVPPAHFAAVDRPFDLFMLVPAAGPPGSPSAVGEGSGAGTVQQPEPAALIAAVPAQPQAMAAPLEAPAAAPAMPVYPAVLRSPDSGTAVKRWSGDAWLLLRKDTTTAVTSGRGSYGQSQLGAVLRYDLLPGSDFRPATFVRASQALAGAEESEVAAGLSARPVPALPLVAAAELRATRVKGELEWRPAAYVYTQIPPVALPLDVTAEAYLQAGYVGGDFATAFVDGQLRADRPVLSLGAGHVDLGAGVWGGAQEGAERLDVGPGATVELALGGVSSRLSLDWRFRVAGDAQPSSGPALTISAGF